MSLLSPLQNKLILDALRPLGASTVYGFGSRFNGRANKDSDLDLAFWSTEKNTPFALFELAGKLAEKLHVDHVDLIDLSRASTVMAAEVIRTGTLLLEKSPIDRAKYEGRALADYARLNEERRLILHQLGAL